MSIFGKLTERVGDFFRIAGQVAFEAGVAFGLAPDRAGSNVRPGRAPADGPRARVGAPWIGIGLDHAIAAQTGETFEIPDQLDPRRPDPPTWTAWTTVR